MPSTRHLIKQHYTGSGEDQGSLPDAERESFRFREGDADLRERVIDEDEDDGQDEAGGLLRAWTRSPRGTPISIRTRQAKG